ncbi:MAG: hypothetical protein WDZ96_01715, partial [Acidimicrobiia bacterium]
MAPGPELAATLAGIDRSMLNGYELVILIQAERRQVAHYEAASFQSMTELAHCSPGYAGSPEERRTTRSRSRGHRTVPAGSRCVVPWRDRRSRARVIVNTLAHLETRQIHRITEEMIDRATELTTGELGAMLRRRAITVDPDSAGRRHRKGRDDRRVVREANSDGTANIIAFNLGVLTANRIMKRICALAEAAKTGTDPRTIDQVRADVFVDLLIRPHTNSPPATGRRGVVDTRVDLTTLAELDENPRRTPRMGPGHLRHRPPG